MSCTCRCTATIKYPLLVPFTFADLIHPVDLCCILHQHHWLVPTIEEIVLTDFVPCRRRCWTHFDRTIVQTCKANLAFHQRFLHLLKGKLGQALSGLYDGDDTESLSISTPLMCVFVRRAFSKGLKKCFARDEICTTVLITCSQALTG